MRRVDLTGTNFTGKGSRETDKITGHLNARMEELVEDGLIVSHEMRGGVGRVSITFPNQESQKALTRLASYGVAATVEADHVTFTVTDQVTHEDMDYVQGAVMEILYE